MDWDGSLDHEGWDGTDHVIMRDGLGGSFYHEGWVRKDYLIMGDGLGQIS